MAKGARERERAWAAAYRRTMEQLYASTRRSGVAAGFSAGLPRAQDKTTTWQEGKRLTRDDTATTHTDAPVWSVADSLASGVEGWDIFDNSERGMEIERIDDKAEFANDAEAVAYVSKRMDEGSSRHIRAWMIHVRGQLVR